MDGHIKRDKKPPKHRQGAHRPTMLSQCLHRGRLCECTGDGSLGVHRGRFLVLTKRAKNDILMSR